MSSNVDDFVQSLRDYAEKEIPDEIQAIRSEMEFVALRSCVDLTPVRQTGPEEGRGHMKASWVVRRYKSVTYIRNTDWKAFFVDNGTVRTRAASMVSRTVELLKSRFGS